MLAHGPQQEITLLASIKSCTRKRDLKEGSRIHAYICESESLRNNVYIESTLVNMYAKCGAFAKAQQTFDDILNRDVVCWNALIAGYGQQEFYWEVFSCYEEMKHEGLSPDAVTFTCIIKACGCIGALESGKELNAEVVREGMLDQDAFVGTALVDMYGKCGALAEAQDVFDELPSQSLVSWNALIAGYTQHAHGEEVLNCFGKMQNNDVSPDATTFACILKVCGSIGAFETGEKIHAEVIRQALLENNVLVGTTLVDMYIKCNSLTRAHELFDELPIRNVISWNAIITGCADHGQNDKVLTLFKQMKDEGLTPNAVTYISILKAYGIVRAIGKCTELYVELVILGLVERYILLNFALMDVFGKCDALMEAHDIFDRLPANSRDTAAYSLLIGAYAHHGHFKEALNCYDSMQCEGILPTALTFACVARACGSAGETKRGKQIHAIVIGEMLGNNTSLAVALLDMYAACGALEDAEHIFDELQVRDVISWTMLIAGYTNYGHGEKAWKWFAGMLQEGFSPDAAVLLCILKLCGSLGAIEKGHRIHTEMVKEVKFENNEMLGMALITMYMQCGVLRDAQQVFDNFRSLSVISWNALIAGYVQHGHAEEALNCFECMQYKDNSPDTVTYVYVLKACGSIGEIDKGKRIHAEIVREGLLEKSVTLGTALVEMYAKCSLLAKAQDVFNELPVRNVATWTVLISGYVQHGDAREALSCFGQMQHDSLSSDAVILTWIAKACSDLGAIERNEIIFPATVNEGDLQDCVLLKTALIDMYVKSGILSKAHHIFRKLPIRDVLSWTALISGYAQFGEGHDVFLIFNKMLEESTVPDLVILTIMLNACSHAGLLFEGQLVFRIMGECYDIMPTLEHFTGMVDIFARAGLFENALAVIKQVPYVDHFPLWTVFLAACQRWGCVKLGGLAFQHALQLNAKFSGSYIFMRNIYVVADLQEGVEKVEAMGVEALSQGDGG